MSVVDSWAVRAAKLDTVDGLAELWQAGATGLGLADGEGNQ